MITSLAVRAVSAFVLCLGLGLVALRLHECVREDGLVIAELVCLTGCTAWLQATQQLAEQLAKQEAELSAQHSHALAQATRAAAAGHERALAAQARQLSEEHASAQAQALAALRSECASLPPPVVAPWTAAKSHVNKCAGFKRSS